MGWPGQVAVRVNRLGPNEQLLRCMSERHAKLLHDRADFVVRSRGAKEKKKKLRPVQGKKNILLISTKLAIREKRGKERGHHEFEGKYLRCLINVSAQWWQNFPFKRHNFRHILQELCLGVENRVENQAIALPHKTATNIFKCGRGIAAANEQLPFFSQNDALKSFQRAC